MKRFTPAVAALLLTVGFGPAATGHPYAGSLYECWPIEPEPGEMVVCPLGPEDPLFAGKFGWFPQDSNPDPTSPSLAFAIQLNKEGFAIQIHKVGNFEYGVLSEVLKRLVEKLETVIERTDFSGPVSDEVLERIIEELEEEFESDLDIEITIEEVGRF
ncbi:MAG: hypothetical protein OXM87_08160 [Truepera sp.]|nr:hypothetical protein [Truepera sp.]